MIAVDTSALIAIVLDESRAAACRDVLEAETRVVMSAGTLVETLIVAAGRGVSEEIGRLVEGLAIDVVPVTAGSARRAAAAYARWGKGFDPAGLNYGDCFAYEVAAANGCALLFVGDDFARTDIDRVV